MIVSSTDRSKVHFLWEEPGLPVGFRTGVSLHSHTLHSKENLGFIPKLCGHLPVLGKVIAKHKADYKRRNDGRELDFRRAWWTPPLGAREAWMLEKDQIEKQLNLPGLVSLTDHDNIDAARQLRVLEEGRRAPISVEWTVPFHGTFFHIGIHNMPMAVSAEWMTRMQQVTADPQEAAIRELFELFTASPQVLIILNHPMWDEANIGAEKHLFVLGRLIGAFGQYFHAYELNGLRPWSENRRVVTMAQDLKAPLISGGDRHAREPNACVNVSAANGFDEFVSEVRAGYSETVFLPQYREAFKLRIIINMAEVMGEDPDHVLGWRLWSDRVFYQWEDGRVHSLTQLWCSADSKQAVPGVVKQFSQLMNLIRHPHLRLAVRKALGQEELAL